jgi:hypothetical protein
VPKDVPDWTTGTDIPWVKVGDKATTGLGPGNMTTGPIPPGTRALAVVPANSGVTLSGLQVVGHVTGIPYHSSPTIQVTQGWVEYPFNGAADSSADLTWTNCSSIGTHIQVFAVPFSVELPAVGQGTMGVSVPVAIASDQTTLPVTVSGTSDTDANIDSVGGALIFLGQTIAANSLPVVITSDQPAGMQGQHTGASSLPVVLASDQVIGKAGQAAMAASAPVVIASDQSAIPVTTSLANAAPWQVPNLAPTLLIVNFVGGDAHDLIAAVAGKVILLFGLWVEFSAVPGIWTLRDGATTVFEGVGSTVGPFPIPGSGAQVASSGNAFRMFCTNAVTVRGWVLASQV